MLFAKISQSLDVEVYPYSLALLRADNPDDVFADDLDLASLPPEYGVVPVVLVPAPTPGPGQTLDEGLPVLVGGEWCRNWIVHDWMPIERGKTYARVVDGVVVVYPYTAEDIISDFGLSVRPGDFAQMDGEWNVVPVVPVPMPTVAVGEVALEAVPIRVGDQWLQTYAVRPRSAEDLAATKEFMRSHVNRKMGQVFAAGYSPGTGPLAGHTLQVRDLEDRTNWLTSQASYSTAVAMGAGAVVEASFRTAANATVTLSYQDGLTVLLGMAGWGKAIMGKSWALKDAIAAAADFAALTAIDIEAGWPVA